TIPARFRRRRASRLAADPTESGSHPERRTLFGLRLHALGVLLALLVDLELLFEELAPVHLRVETAVFEKLAMRPAFHDAPVVQLRDVSGPVELRIGERFVESETDVLAQRDGKEERLLRHVADGAAELLERPPPDVDAIDEDLALLHIEQARDQVHDGGLAGA